MKYQIHIRTINNDKEYEWLPLRNPKTNTPYIFSSLLDACRLMYLHYPCSTDEDVKTVRIE